MLLGSISNRSPIGARVFSLYHDSMEETRRTGEYKGLKIKNSIVRPSAKHLMYCAPIYWKHITEMDHLGNASLAVPSLEGLMAAEGEAWRINI